MRVCITSIPCILVLRLHPTANSQGHTAETPPKSANASKFSRATSTLSQPMSDRLVLILTLENKKTSIAALSSTLFNLPSMVYLRHPKEWIGIISGINTPTPSSILAQALTRRIFVLRVLLRRAQCTTSLLIAFLLCVGNLCLSPRRHKGVARDSVRMTNSSLITCEI